MVILEKTQTQLKLRYRPDSIWLTIGTWVLAVFLLILLICLQNPWLIYIWWIPLLPLLNLVLGMLILLVFGQVVTCHFDKDYNSLTIKRRSLLNTKIIWYSLADILDIKLKSTSWRHDQKASYQIVVVLKSGQNFPLTFWEWLAVHDQLETVNVIRKFLSLPPQKLGW